MGEAQKRQADAPRIGFIGLGVMGAPICRNMLQKSGADFLVHDRLEAPMARLAEHGARPAASAAEVADGADIVFLSLPGGRQVEEVLTGPGGIVERGRPGQVVADLSTIPVGLTQALAARLQERGLRFADAPVARTRQAAESGSLSIMVGAEPDLFDSLLPLLAHAATDVTHCGPVGCGQVTKILNNMVLFQTVIALSEALALGRGAGMDPRLLLETLAKGSADSFALRNHGMKAMLADCFPEDAFPTDYALKDIACALELAAETGIDTPGARLARARLQAASDAGHGRAYFPVLSRLAGRGGGAGQSGN